MALPEPIQAAAPPPKTLALVRLAEGSLPPNFRARPERTTSVRFPDKRVKSRFPKLRRLLSSPTPGRWSVNVATPLEHK